VRPYLVSLYTLHPTKEKLDLSSRLHKQAMECFRRKEWVEALGLLSSARKWHCTMGILLTEGQIHAELQRYLLIACCYLRCVML
jgi:hypothetical protein